MDVGFKPLVMWAGGIPVKKGAQQGNIGAAVPFASLRGGSLVDDVAPRGTNDLHADGRDEAKDGVRDGEWALSRDRGEASGLRYEDSKVNRGKDVEMRWEICV